MGAMHVMSKLRFNISMSLDGYVAGPNQSSDDPLGEGGEQLHDWVVRTRAFKSMRADSEDGETGLDNDRAEHWRQDFGATIMGRNMFGPIRGDWGDEEWRGWWGDNPPYHSPDCVDWRGSVAAALRAGRAHERAQPARAPEPRPQSLGAITQMV